MLAQDMDTLEIVIPHDSFGRVAARIIRPGSRVSVRFWDSKASHFTFPKEDRDRVMLCVEEFNRSTVHQVHHQITVVR